MLSTIKCPKCGESFEPTEAFKHQLKEEIRESVKKEQKADIENAVKKANSENEILINRLRKDSDEEKERNTRLLKQLEDLSFEIRKLRRKDEERELEMKRKIADEEEKIREDARKKALEDHDLKDREKDKKLTDALKQIEDLKARIQQGSQQTQGEVLELELEEILKNEFPQDTIEEVKKGQRGADIIQRVFDKKGNNCGKILWESKNAKWDNNWIFKLKDNQREANSDLAVLVVSNPPDGLENFKYNNGVWIVIRNMVVPLALALRFDLVRVNYEKLANVGKHEKTEILFKYITSTEFRHRIEAIVETFGQLQDETEREKRWFQTKWARQEKQLRKVIDHTQGMYGDLQGVIGRSLPDIKPMQLDEGNKDIS